jgi:hypothetical protein
MKNSYSKESIHCFMYGVVQPWLIKDMIPLQNCTHAKKVLVCPCGETYPGSHYANQAINIKAEEDSDSQDEVDPAQIAVQEVKSEPQVSCVFLYVQC